VYVCVVSPVGDVLRWGDCRSVQCLPGAPALGLEQVTALHVLMPSAVQVALALVSEYARESPPANAAA